MKTLQKVFWNNVNTVLSVWNYYSISWWTFWGAGNYISFIEAQTMCEKLPLYSCNASDPDIFMWGAEGINQILQLSQDMWALDKYTLCKRCYNIIASDSLRHGNQNLNRDSNFSSFRWHQRSMGNLFSLLNSSLMAAGKTFWVWKKQINFFLK